MSVLIKGMEMPTSCEDCPLGDSLHCQVLPSVPALWAEYTNAIREKRLHSDCPLVPVPEHFKAKVLTNADRIRAMTDEELAEWLDNNTCQFPIYKDWLEWLRQEADNENPR